VSPFGLCSGAMGEPGFVVTAGGWFVYLAGDQVVVEEAVPLTRRFEVTPHRDVLPVAAATAQLVGDTLHISADGQPWAEVEDVQDLVAGRDFCDELRRLRWTALQPTPQPAPPPFVRTAPQPAPAAPIGPTVGQHVAGLVGDLVARLRAGIAQTPRQR
jgi:hypothetical protein